MNDLKTISTSSTRLQRWMVPVAGFSSLLLAAGIAVLFATPVEAKLLSVLSPNSRKVTAPVVAMHPTPETLIKRTKPEHKLHGGATWYGSVLNGHRTASGDRFNMYDMTACHPTLPFGTIVRVTDQRTHRSVVVRINDRGILSEGRIIDLSYAAANKLGILRLGVATVALQVIHMGDGHHHWVKDPPGERVVPMTGPTETASR